MDWSENGGGAMNKILVVDDDANIRELLCLLLRDEGFDVLSAVDGSEALTLLEAHRVDLCLLDVMMPNLDGWGFCEEARRYWDFPILMLTAKAETVHKVRGFALGVDDYLTKPFEPAELVARVRALLRRYNVACSRSLRIGALVVDRNSHTVTADGLRQDIPMKEFELLFLLGSHAGRTLSRDRLIEEVWGPDFEGNERTLDVHVSRLRERFPQERCRVRIATIRGLGYRLEVLE